MNVQQQAVLVGVKIMTDLPVYDVRLHLYTVQGLADRCRYGIRIQLTTIMLYC